MIFCVRKSGVQNQARFRKRARRSAVLALVLLMGATIGCTTAQERDDDESAPMSPNARLYAYLIVNGMARGAFLSGHLTRRDMPALVEIDQKTRVALERNLHHPSTQQDFQIDELLARYIGHIPS